MMIDLKVPGCWAELTSAQVIFAGWLYSLNVTRQKMLAMAFLKFAGLCACRTAGGLSVFRRVRRLGNLCPARFAVSPEEFRDFCERLSFLTDDIGIMPAPDFAGFEVPDNRLFDVSLDEYLTVDFYYLSICSGDSDDRREYAGKIVATLWKKKRGFFWRFRRIRLSRGDTMAVYLWYTGVKRWLRAEYPLIFCPAGGGETPRETVLGLLSVFNGGKPQDNTKILQTSMHEVFFELNRIQLKN
jgi:hypothetical protein